jgi:hypothetical protein
MEIHSSSKADQSRNTKKTLTAMETQNPSRAEQSRKPRTHQNQWKFTARAEQCRAEQKPIKSWHQWKLRARSERAGQKYKKTLKPMETQKPGHNRAEQKTA